MILFYTISVLDINFEIQIMALKTTRKKNKKLLVSGTVLRSGKAKVSCYPIFFMKRSLKNVYQKKLAIKN
jgi:hypothetical protein